MTNPIVHIGIDPGQHGAVVLIRENGKWEGASLEAPEDEREDWVFDVLRIIRATIRDIPAPPPVTIERIVPRPTFFGGTSSILKSTCEIYGDYKMIRGMLVAFAFPFIQEVLPKAWQSALKIRARASGETDAHWKGHLRKEAGYLYPKSRVNLQEADALLIATYGLQKSKGLIK